MDKINRRWRPLRGRSNRRKQASRTNATNKSKDKENMPKNINTPNAAEENRPASASTRKLSSFDQHNDEKNVEFVNNTDEFLLFHTSALQCLVKQYFCSGCNLVGVVNFQITNRFGQAAEITLYCDNCEENVNKIFTSPKDDNSKFIVNEKVVDAFCRIGSGRSSMETFFATLGMHVMSNTTYYFQLNCILEKSVQLKSVTLAKSRKIVRETYENLYSLEPDQIIDLIASFDGSWHKRGHTSLYGIGCVIDVITGLVVYYEILSKYCHMCVNTANDLGEDSPEFYIWYQGHKKFECCKNYEGSSNSMEVAAASIMWKRSVAQSKFRYRTIVSDGDSKAFNHLTQEKVYGDIELEREQCINHVKKRLTTALKEEVKRAKVKSKSHNIFIFFYSYLIYTIYSYYIQIFRNYSGWSCKRSIDRQGYNCTEQLLSERNHEESIRY